MRLQGTGEVVSWRHAGGAWSACAAPYAPITYEDEATLNANTIAAKAEGAAGVKSVDNQLEIASR